MIPVAIVEDEPWIRRLLIRTIDWKTQGLKLVVEAENGPQALRLCIRAKPRIVFTDVRIPGFDGLVLIERLTGQLEGTLYAIISGHSDFAYAQRALQLGVRDYLLKPIQAVQVEEVLTRMLQEIGRADGEKRRRKQTERLTVTLQHTLRQMERPVPSPAGMKRQPAHGRSHGDVRDPRIARAIEILNERIAERVSVDDIAVSVGMSRSSFADHFRAETGQTLIAYLNERRVELAMALLKHPEYAVAEVGRMAGFSDPNYFIRIFRNRLAETPGDYRDRVLHKRARS